MSLVHCVPRNSVLAFCASIILALPGSPTSSMALGSWSPETEVTAPDEYVDGGQSLCTDADGTPWLVWYRKVRGSQTREVTHWSRWLGTSWSSCETLDSNPGGFHHKPRIRFDETNVGWAVWNENSGSDIWYSRYVSGSWTPSSQVHPDDPSEFYSPEIAVGGGEVWLVWYGHPGADPRYDVFISRWTGTDWAPATMLSGTVPGGAWFCDVAVDASGSPHVVWTDFYDSGKIWYTTLSDESWTDPVGINDPDQVRAGGWASPRIVSDLEAGLHVVWIGAAPPGRLGTRNDLDVFYSRSDGSGWTTPIQVNADDSAEAYYPELAVRNPNDMWIVWSDEGQDWHDAAVVQVAHFDGTSASGQQRLDSGRFQWNQVARVTIDGQGNPWVVWGAIHSDFSESAILYSRFQESVPVYLSNFDWEPREDGVRITWMASEDLFSSFLLERSSQGDSYVEIGRVSASGHGSFGFEDRGVLPGTYLYRLTGVLRDGTTEVFAPMEVRFSVTRLEMWAASPLVRGDVIKLSVQSGSAAEAAFAIFDVEGRQVSTQGPVNLVSGLNEITLQARDRSKQLLGSGVYFVRLTSGDQSLATRFMRVR